MEEEAGMIGNYDERIDFELRLVDWHSVYSAWCLYLSSHISLSLSISYLSLSVYSARYVYLSVPPHISLSVYPTCYHSASRFMECGRWNMEYGIWNMEYGR